MSSAKSRQSAGEVDFLVGKRIRLAREILGLSMESLASHLGVSWQQVQKYEQGRNRIACSRLVGIAEFLGVGVGDLLAREGSMGTPEIVSLLSVPGATSLLRDYARITDDARRQIILTAAQRLAVSSTQLPTAFEE